MAKILIVGDSQSVNPGFAAERKFKAAGHKVLKVSNVGKGPHDYVRLPALWSEYTRAVASFTPDLIVMFFGTNDAPDLHLIPSLDRLKTAVKPKVLLSGPPRYPAADKQQRGEKIRELYQAAFGSDYIDSYPFTSETLPRAKDGLHFTAEGAVPWGEAVAAEALKRL